MEVAAEAKTNNTGEASNKVTKDKNIIMVDGG